MTEPTFFRDIDDHLFMLHGPTDRQVEVMKALGCRPIEANTFREEMDDRMDRDGSVPTGGYEELDVGE